MTNVFAAIDKLLGSDLDRLLGQPLPPWMGSLLREQLSSRPDWQSLADRLPGLDRLWQPPDGGLWPGLPPADDARPKDSPVVLPGFAQEVEPNDLMSQATAMQLGVRMDARIGSFADADWFRLDDVVAGAYKLSFTAPRSGIGLLDSYWIGIGGADGRLLEKVPVSRQGEFRLDVKAPMQSMTLLVQSATGFFSGQGSYALQIDALTPPAEPKPQLPGVESEPNDQAAAADDLAVGHAVSGRLGSLLDEDWFRITPDADGRLRVTLDTRFDSRWFKRFDIGLVDADGKVLDQVYTGGDAALEIDAQQGQPIFVRVSGAGWLADASAYSLSVSAVRPTLPQADALTGTRRADVLVGGQGDDVLDGQGGDDRIDGRGGLDTAVFHVEASALEIHSAAGLTVVRGTPSAGPYARHAVRIWNVETLALADQVVTLETAADDLAPKVGTARSERLLGGPGDDLLDGAGGSDTVVGGAGFDTWVLFGADEDFSITSLAGIARVHGRSTADEYAGSLSVATGVERILTASGAVFDVESGGSAVPVLGTRSSDLLRGTSADEVFDGLGGQDVIDGAAGQDTLVLFAPRASFGLSWSVLGDETLRITGLAGSGLYEGSTISARHIERLRFLDADMDLARPVRLVLDPSGLQLTEGAGAQTVAVSLSAAPSQPLQVQVQVGSASDLAINPSALVFTPQDWNEPRLVSVSAIDDELVEPAEIVRVHFTLSAADDQGTTAIDTRSLAYAIADNDSASTGSVSGRLWHDADRDGLPQDAEVGLAGWTVFVDENGNGHLDSAEPTTRSDLNGRWRLSDLAPGPHDVMAVPRAGWVPTDADSPATSGATLLDADPGDGTLTLDDLQVWSVDAAQAQDLAAQIGSSTGLEAFRTDPRFAGIDGSGTAIVIIDTGIDLSHPHFGPDDDADGVPDRLVYQFDFVGAGDAVANDGHGHGTHVAGIAAGSDPAFPGVAPGADLIVLRVLGDDGTGRSSDLREAVDWVVAHAQTYGIVAVNLSLGFGEFDREPTPGFLSTPFKALADNGIAVVAASGNGYAMRSVQGVAYPSSDPWALSVGAVWSGAGSLPGLQTGSADAIAAFSQRDDTESDVFGPGVGVTAAALGGGVTALSGTSMAAPHVTGMIALAQQLAQQELGRRLTLPEIRHLIEDTAVLIRDGDDEADAVPNTGLTFGRIDMLAMAQAIIDQPAPTSVRVEIVAGRNVDGVDFGFAPLQTPQAPASDDFIVGTSWAEVLDGGAGHDRLQGGEGDDTLLGGAGDDWLVPGSGNDLVRGGDGHDTVAYPLRSTEVTWSIGVRGIVKVVAPDGSTDTLHEVEALAFEDDLVLLTPDSAFTDAAAGGASAEAVTAKGDAGAGAIGLNDAVAILRMISGRAGPGTAADIRQSVAADFDADGTVSLADALGVLRHAVGLEASPPAWVTFDHADPALADRPTLQPGRVWAPDALVQELMPAAMDLVSVLRGDVDASAWRSAYGVYEQG